MKSDQLYVIAHRFNQSLRLNEEVYPSFDEAKAALNHWENELDPRMEFHIRSEQARIAANRRVWTARPKHHNNRDFEVVSLEYHIYNVAHSNYEKTKRESRYVGCFNTLLKKV